MSMDRPLMIELGTYQAFTANFTTEQHGAFLLLMMFRKLKGRLPYDHQQLATIARVHNVERWKKLIWPGISGWFVICADDPKSLDITLCSVWDQERAPRLDVPLSKWGKLRISVFERDAFTCQYCGEANLSEPHCDHVVPRARGGASTLENLATSCAICNVKKGAQLIEEWRQ